MYVSVSVCACFSRHKSTPALFDEIARAAQSRTIPLMFPLEKQERGKAKESHKKLYVTCRRSTETVLQTEIGL